MVDYPNNPAPAVFLEEAACDLPGLLLEIRPRLRCGAVMKLGPDLGLAGFTDAEMDALVQDHEWMDQIARMVQRVHFVKHASN